jgi:hypothetical protein
LLGVLVPDETTRRAFEETLADWRDEWTRASSPIDRIRVSTRGWISIARLAAGTIRMGWLASDTWTVLVMAVMVSAVLSLLMIPSIWSYAPGPLTLPEFSVAVLLLLPQGMVVLLAPVAAIGVGAKPWREPSVIAVALALVLTMILFTGWVFPASNQMYREYVFSKLSDGPRLVLSGLAEMSGPQLIREATGGTSLTHWPAIGQLATRLALVVLVPVSFVFGVAVRRRLALRTRWGIARFVAGASAACAFAVSDYAVLVLRDVSPAIADLPGRGGLSIWLSSLVLCLAIVVLARNSNPEPI